MSVVKRETRWTSISPEPGVTPPSSAETDRELTEWTFEAIGTQWQIIAEYSRFSHYRNHYANDIHDQISRRIADFDKNYSRFRADSLITRISREPGSYEMPDDFFPLMDFYQQLYDLTDGRVTPLIGNTLAELGYNAHYDFLKSAIKPDHPPLWEDSLDYSDNTLTVKRFVNLDFGAAGKGYLVDLVHKILVRRMSHFHVVNAGGDIRIFNMDNEKAPDIGLENPSDITQAVGIGHVTRGSLCGSSGARRKWSNGQGTFTHTIDPSSLHSPEQIISSWVYVDENSCDYPTMTADGLATCLFFVPPTVIESLRIPFEYAVIDSGHRLHYSPHFPAQFFLEEGDSNASA